MPGPGLHRASIGHETGGAPCAGTRYRIRVRGALGSTLVTAFPELRAEPGGGETLLTGALADQAALYGVLAEIEALGLELIEGRCEDHPARPGPAAPSTPTKEIIR